MVPHASNPRTWEVRWSNCEVKVSLVYIARPCQNKIIYIIYENSALLEISEALWKDRA